MTSDRLVREDTHVTRYEAALAAGMTPGEALAFDRVSEAAGIYLRLTEDEPGHGMEREEVCHAFHVIQGWLAGRPTMRRMEEARKR